MIQGAQSHLGYLGLHTAYGQLRRICDEKIDFTYYVNWWYVAQGLVLSPAHASANMPLQSIADTRYSGHIYILECIFTEHLAKEPSWRHCHDTLATGLRCVETCRPERGQGCSDRDDLQISFLLTYFSPFFLFTFFHSFALRTCSVKT